MWVTITLIISIAFQFVAAFLAVRLIQVTGKKIGWSLIAAAITLMAVRRSITLFYQLTNGGPSDLYTESIPLTVSMIISVLMAAGIAAITPLFVSMKESEEALRRSEERFRRYFELGLIGMAITSPTKGILEVNDKLCEILGYERNELMKLTWAELPHPDDLSADVAQFNRVLAREIDGYSMDLRFIRKDGQVIDSTISVKCVRRPDGSVDHFVALLQDITERKQAEETLKQSEEKYRTLVQQAFDGIFIADLSGKILDANPKGCRMLDYTDEEILRLNLRDIVAPEDLPRVPEAISRLKTGNGWIDEWRLLRRDGAIFPAEISGKALSDGRLLGIVRDITERKHAELERQKFVSLADNSTEFIGMCDMDFMPLYINQAGLDLVGLDSLEQTRRTPVLEFFFPEDRRFLTEDLFPRMFREGRAQAEIRFRHFKTGEPIWMLYNVFYIGDPASKPIAIAAVSIDITQRKRYEEALQEAEARLRLALQAGRIGTWDWNLTTGKIIWSSRHEALWEMPPGTFKGTYEEFEARLHPDDRDGVKRATAQAIAERSNFRIEYRVVWSDGSVHWVAGQGEPLCDESGRPVRMIGVVMDITETKQAEEALYASRALLNNIIDSTPSYIFAMDQQNRYTLINEASTGLLGMPKEEILGKTEHGVFPKELADALQAANNRVMATGVPLETEEVVGGKGGPPRTMITVKFPVRDAYGKIIGLGGVATDITERKQAEEALRESEQRNREQYAELHQLYQTAPVGLALVDHELRFVRINDRLAEINGRPAEQHIGRAVSEVLPQLWPTLEPIYRRAMSGEPVLDVQIHGVTPAQPGAERDWVASYYPVLGDDGFVRGASVVVQEVTESKQAEKALRKSEERLRLVTLATHDAVWDWDLATNTIWWNETFKETFRYKTEEIKLGFEFWESLIHPEDRETILSDLQATLDKGEQFLAEEYRLRRGDGSYAIVLDRGFVLRDQNGKPVRMVGAIMDITERKRYEEALQEAEARLQLALQAGRIGTWDWNLTTGKIVWSSRHEALWGMAPGTFKGTYEEFEARLHPDDRDGVKRATARAIAEHSNFRIEYRVVWSDGSVHWIAGQGEPLFDESGRPVRMIGVVMDITERKQAEEALRKSEERFELASRATNDVIWDWDLVTNAVQWNERFQTLFGYQPEEIESGVESWTNRLHPEDKGRILSEVDDAIKQGHQFWSGEYRFRRGDGSYAAVFDRGYVVHDGNGRPVRMIGAMLDITERKRAEEALGESENRLRQILDGLFGFVGLYTLDGTIIEVNEAPLLAGGVKREEVLGRPFWETYWWNYDQRVQAELKDAMARAARGELIRYEPVVRVQGDRLITVDTTFGPLRDRSGKVAFILAFGVDITERKRAEKAIRELNQDLERRVADRTAQLEAANKELESFSYSVSHDLRAPLRGISGFSRVLLTKYADQLDAQGKDFLQRVDAASRRMGELIEDLLNLSRVTRSQIRKEPVDLTLLARSIAEDLQRSDPKRRVTFLIQEGLKASADPHLLRIVLENLLGNAWKFTSKHLMATIELGRIEKNGKPVYFVRDDGAGFDMAYADKLFGAFQRLHSLNEFAGTGIGLASVQRIIHRHGGEIWAEGAVEKGATFYFTL